MKIVYFGTPQFAANVLEYLLANDIDIVAIITKPDKPKGRSGTPIPTPVKEIAQRLAPEIPIYQPEKVSDDSFKPIIEQYNADLFVVVAYGEIIKQHLLDMPKNGCINLHASLLPYYRGAAPIQRCIIAGEKESGLTVMHMVKKMDAGAMIKKAVVPIESNTTYGELETNLCVVGKKLLLEVIKEMGTKQLPGEEQDHEKATFAPKVELEDCEIDWQQSAHQLHNLIRGVNPEPVAWINILVKGEKKRLKVYSSIVHEGAQGNPGEILSYGNKGLLIACGKDALELIDIQLEGKKKMPAKEWMRGISAENISFEISENTK